MNNLNGSFYVNVIDGTKKTEQEIVVDVVSLLPNKDCSFNVIYKSNGHYNVYGHMYSGKEYGLFTVRLPSGESKTYSLFKGSYTERIDNFGYNTLEGLATALKPLLGLS